MPAKIKSITNPRLSLSLLSPAEVQRVHTAPLEVIESVGVRFPSVKALNIWEDHGAAVDRESNIVRAPGHLIEESLRHAPPLYTLAAREPAQDLPLDGNHVYVGTDGCGVEVIDLFTGQRLDLRTGAYTGGGPEDFLFGAATNVLADFYNVPLSMGSFATGAKEPNWQAGIENSLSTFMASVVMSDMLLGVGLLHGSRIWSYEQMLLDCEIFDLVRKVMGGVTVDEERLALNAIRQVGPGGNFLAQKHTKQYMHDLWLPKYMDRRPYNVWEKKRDGACDWAGEEARRILSSHQPESLEPEVAEELDRIIAAVEGK